MFTDAVDGLPERLNPYIISTDLNEPIVLLKGPFKLVGSISGTLESDLSFRWSPSIAVEFEGLFSEPHPVLDDARWYLEGISGDEFRVARLKACAKGSALQLPERSEGRLQARVVRRPADARDDPLETPRTL